MGWAAMSFPGSSGLTSAEMTAIASNFYSAFNQESGSPPPTGTWSWANTSVLNAPGSHHFGQITVDSGIAGLLSSTESFNSINVASGITAPQVNSFGAVNAASGFILRGFATKQLLQRVALFSATSRGTTSAVYSTYAVASITPVSSLSQILVQAGIYGSAINGALGGFITSHLMRNPAGAVTSFAYLTASAIAVNSVGAQPMGTIGALIAAVSIQGMAAFVVADSAINVDPKQYGVDWNYVFGNVQGVITGGYLTLEEWL